MRWLFLVPFCAVFFSISSYSADKSSDTFLDKASSEFVYEKKEEKESRSKKASWTIRANQITGFIESTDYITNLSASFNYPIQESLSFSASQTLNRNYYIKTDEIDSTGLWIQDTVLSLSKTAKWIEGSQFAFGLSSSLPISYYSRLNKVSTVTSLSMSASMKMLPLFKIESPVIKELNLFVQPAFRYYFSDPVTPTVRKNKKGELIPQSSGGRLLPQMLFGVQSMGMTLKVSDKWSFSSSVGRWAIVPYKLKHQNKFSPYKGKKYYRHYYSISLSTSYQVFKALSLQLAYSHTDRLDKGGQIQHYVLFDDQISSWLVSAVYSFSKDSLFKKSSAYSN